MEETKMTLEQKLNLLQGRINLLENRGPHNNAIVKKLIRKKRQLEKQMAGK